MDLNALATTQMLIDYRGTNSRLVRSMGRLSTGERAATAKDDPILWGEVQALKSEAMTLAGYSDNLNRGASTVRIALASMDVARSHLLQAEEKLNAAYAEKPGSVERAKAIEAYNELLEFVDDASSAPDPGARLLLQDPALNADAGGVDIRAGEDGFSVRLEAREIHTGATGLDLPRAGAARPSDLVADPFAPPVIADISNATNQEIEQMLEFISASKEDLVAKIKALSVNASAIEEAESFNAAFILRNEGQADDLNVVDLNAEAVLAQSLQLRGELSISGLSGMNDTYRIAIQLLK